MTAPRTAAEDVTAAFLDAVDELALANLQARWARQSVGATLTAMLAAEYERGWSRQGFPPDVRAALASPDAPANRDAGKCNCAHRGNAYLCQVHTQDDFEAADRAIGRTAEADHEATR